MRLGVLDVGSNTVHLLVVYAHTGARPIPATSQKSVLRLMRYLEPDGSIGEVGVRAIIDAVVNAVAAAREADIDELLAFATSAIREATNGEQAVEAVHVVVLRIQPVGVILRRNNQRHAVMYVGD